MPFQTIFWITVAVVALIIVPIVMIASIVAHFRTRGSERKGSGGITSGIGAAMQELDRLMARPSVEHQLETRDQTAKQNEAGTD